MWLSLLYLPLLKSTGEGAPLTHTTVTCRRPAQAESWKPFLIERLPAFEASGPQLHVQDLSLFEHVTVHQPANTHKETVSSGVLTLFWIFYKLKYNAGSKDSGTLCEPWVWSTVELTNHFLSARLRWAWSTEVFVDVLSFVDAEINCVYWQQFSDVFQNSCSNIFNILDCRWWTL